MEKNIIDESGKAFVFRLEPYGPGTYEELGDQIRADGYSPATANQVFSILQNFIRLGGPGVIRKTKCKRYRRFLKSLYSALEDFGIWGYTGSFFVPNEGLYLQDNPKVEDNKLIMDREDFIERIKKDDSSLRFVPAQDLFLPDYNFSSKAFICIRSHSYFRDLWDSNSYHFEHSYEPKNKIWSGVAKFGMETSLESCGHMSESGWHTSVSYYYEYSYLFSPSDRLQNKGFWFFKPYAKSRCAIGVREEGRKVHFRNRIF